MKFLFLLALTFLTQQARALDCDENTLEATTTTYPLTCDTLIISSSPDLSHLTQAIDIQVSGDVVINAAINLNGVSATPISTNMTSGAAGGPGAEPGGGSGFNGPEDNPECPPYNPFGPCPYAGSRGGEDPISLCGTGAGGAGFVASGEEGSLCLSSTMTPSQGGSTFSYSSIESTLRGGFGGGAGGGFNLPIAGGGGGGGAIRITATGKITVTTNGTITANGGKGADASGDNGAGGGGSGGVIILEATTFDIQGPLLALGGAGGNASNGGHGGAGSNGLIRLKDAQGVDDFFGAKNPSPTVITQELKLDSNISCGTVSLNEKDNKSFFFQLFIPLFLFIILGLIRKKDRILL